MKSVCLVACLFSLLVALLLTGCGGSAGQIATEPPDADPIMAEWTASAQSDTLGGARVAAALTGSVHFARTVNYQNIWTGTMPATDGAAFVPGSGYWSLGGAHYSVSNFSGQSVQFGFSGNELYSITRHGGRLVYLWWTKD